MGVQILYQSAGKTWQWAEQEGALLAHLNCPVPQLANPRACFRVPSLESHWLTVTIGQPRGYALPSRPCPTIPYWLQSLCVTNISSTLESSTINLQTLDSIDNYACSLTVILHHTERTPRLVTSQENTVFLSLFLKH